VRPAGRRWRPHRTTRKPGRLPTAGSRWAALGRSRRAAGLQGPISSRSRPLLRPHWRSWRGCRGPDGCRSMLSRVALAAAKWGDVGRGSHRAGADAHSNALGIDKDRLTAGHVHPVEACLPVDQKNPDLSIGNDLPMRARGEVDLFEDEVGAGGDHEPRRRQAFGRGLLGRWSSYGRAYGAIGMQFAIAAKVEQSKGRVATLLNLNDLSASAKRDAARANKLGGVKHTQKFGRAKTALPACPCRLSPRSDQDRSNPASWPNRSS